MKIPVRVVLGVVLLALLAGFIHVVQPEAAATQTPHADAKRVGVVASVPTSPVVEILALAELEAEVPRVIAYIEAVTRDEVGRFIVAVQEAEAAAARAAAEAEAQRQRDAIRPASPAVPSGVFHGSGSCYGGPIPDYIVTRESGGDPMAQNPSGAFGCYQIMPEWWSGACSGLDRYTIDGQKQCASIIWNGGAGASNWSETNY